MLWPALRHHVVLVAVAVTIGFAIAFALALAAHRYHRIGAPDHLRDDDPVHDPLAGALRALVAPVGANVFSAEIALVSYTLLILFRNILTGLSSVPAEVLDSAEGMGMSRRQALWRVELPLALPAIIAGCGSRWSR